MSTAFRAPLAERSAVNRQVLGSIPSGGASFLLLFFFRSHAVGQTTAWAVHRTDAMAQWQRVGFQIRRLGVRIPLASSTVVFFCVPVAQLDKASDYESEDWGFESLQG